MGSFFTGDIGAFLYGDGRRENSAAPQQLQTLVVQLRGEAEADPLQGVREEDVRDGGEVGLRQLSVVAHAFQQELLMTGAQRVSQSLITGEMSGYDHQTTVLERFHGSTSELRNFGCKVQDKRVWSESCAARSRVDVSL